MQVGEKGFVTGEGYCDEGIREHLVTVCNVLILVRSHQNRVTPRCAYAVHTLYIRYTYTIHTLYIHYTYAIHTLYIRCTYAVHTLYIRYTYTVHTLYIRCTYTIHTLCVYMYIPLPGSFPPACHGLDTWSDDTRNMGC